MSAKKIRTVTVGDWQAALAQAKRAVADVVPDGWLTARQIGDKMGVPYQNVSTRVIAPMMKVGRAEMRMFSVPNILGVPRKIPHYRLKT